MRTIARGIVWIYENLTSAGLVERSYGVASGLDAFMAADTAALAARPPLPSQMLSKYGSSAVRCQLESVWVTAISQTGAEQHHTDSLHSEQAPKLVHSHRSETSSHRPGHL